MALPARFIKIDEEGFPLFGEVRVTDLHVGHEILSQLQFAENGAFQTVSGGETCIVEAFDEPFVAQQVHKKNSLWIIEMPYDFAAEINLDSLSLDEWDRFHGLTKQNIPFVLSRKAQAEFFRLLDEYEDDSITVDGKKIVLPPWHQSTVPVGTENFWSHIYQTETPGWEMNQPTPILTEMLPQLKIPRSRVLVLGCGSGNDAAYFAQNGNIVTAVDISPEAIRRAQEKYGHIANLKFVQKDIFAIQHEWDGQFDIVFEHTCYCAIDPAQRNALAKLWKRVLIPGGFLMGIFFTMEKRGQPPFGGTEWELRERLKKDFQFMYWNRWRKPNGRRDGKELFVYALKK